MKKVIKIIAGIIGLLLLVTVVFLGVQSIRLKWWSGTDNVSLAELTPEQKADDMRYLLDLTHRITPAEVVWKTAGLDNPLQQPEIWIERARSTGSNSEFANLVLQFLVHIGQGGHAFLAYDANFNPFTSLISDVPKDAFAKMPLWASIVSRLPWNAYADIDIVYQDGYYRLKKDATIGKVRVLAGAVVETVDGWSADQFALQQQYQTHLRYDPVQKKFFIYPLLTIDPGPDRSEWTITFRLPDQTSQTVLVPKIPGFLPYRPDENSLSNVRCLVLNQEVLYIKVATFYREYVSEDAAELRKCFASGSFQKAIFDVRGNNGGEIWSYMDNIMAPLIKQTITYQATVANRDSFYDWYGWRFWLYQWTNDNELTDPRAHVEKVEEIAYPPYSDQGWRVMRVTRRIEPSAEPYPFSGQAYVLTDNNALSAGDSFASAMQQSGLAKVAGANTTGWGQAAQAKMLYGLPNSGILFYVDSELIFNPDGSLDNYTGVAPDVYLNPSTFPTPYPANFTKEALLDDAWVQWVLADRSVRKIQALPGQGCTVFYAADGETALGGNNEDFNNPLTQAWFLPAAKERYGRVYFGFDDYIPQGSLNDQGLFYDGLALPYKSMKVANQRPDYPGGLLALIDEVMGRSDTVEDVLDILGQYNLAGLENSQLFFGDRFGNSVIVDGDTVLHKQGNYQIATNFRLVEAPNPPYADARYNAADGLLSKADHYSVDLFRQVLDATHQEGTAPTLYSQVYELKKGIIHLYQYHNYQDEVVINLADELAKGAHSYTIESLFPKNKERDLWAYQQLQQWKVNYEGAIDVSSRPSALSAYTGEYTLPEEPESSPVKVYLENDRLYFQKQSQLPIELYQASDGALFHPYYNGGELRLTFQRNFLGQVTGAEGAFDFKYFGLHQPYHLTKSGGVAITASSSIVVAGIVLVILMSAAIVLVIKLRKLRPMS